MPTPAPHVDLAAVSWTPTFDIHAIRELLPHRYEMELLTSVVSIDRENHIVIGYKDVTPNEFWAPGHFPGNPIMPGVLMCEAAAQLTCFYTQYTKIHEDVLLGIGGIENTRFRRAVVPGERLLLVGKGIRVRPRMTMFNVQGFVGSEMAFHTDIIGIVLGPRGG